VESSAYFRSRSLPFDREVGESLLQMYDRCAMITKKKEVRQMNITLMSYNTQHCMNYVTREIDFDIMLDTIQKCGADIIGLQEMYKKGVGSVRIPQAEYLAEKLGFYHYFASALRPAGGNDYGNALISRYPILEAETIMIPNPPEKKYHGYYETRCLLKAKLDVGDGLTVLVSHFGLNPDEQENAVQTVISNLAGERCVLLGDFNMQPENEILNPIRERLFDTAEKFDAPKLSFPSDHPDRKIDYIFTSRDLKVCCADIPAIVSSDHRPHIATVEIR